MTKQSIETIERDVLDFRHVDARIQIEMKFAKYFKMNFTDDFNKDNHAN